MPRTRLFPAARLLAALILFALLLAPARAARADSAPPPPPEGANLFPDGEITEVRMEAETVDIQVVDSPAQPDGQARVSAEFHMRNLGEKDETMQVRFPLSTFYIGNTPRSLECISAGYPTIQDFNAWVDGKLAAVTKTYQDVDNFGPNGGGKVNVPCWANFPAVFPVGKEVVLKVSYTFPSYSADPSSGHVYFNYILRTGAGWKGTIGSADISLRMPYAIDDYNLAVDSTTPRGGTVSGDTIRWRLSNFEPADGPDVNVMVTRPSLWRQIVKETANTQANPKDGEAWGRLGKAYKQAIWERRGYRDGAAGAEMFDRSAAAYQKAVTLKPRDADWHAGYAELLCWDAAFPFMHTPEATRDNMLGCLKELKLALEINPKQAKASEILKEWTQWIGPGGTPVVDLSQGTPVYTALTSTPPLPTDQPTETPPAPETPPPTDTAQPGPTATATEAGTSTPAAVSQASPLPATDTPGAIVTPTPAPRKPGLAVCGSVFLPLAITALLWLVRRRHSIP